MYRGKFGLGSKMALIWSKKSTGMPIEITSAKSLDPSKPPAFVSHCVLDIDIYRNEPHVIKHTKTPNTDNWRGTKISVVVGGNWTTYRAKVLHYFQQLAIITPYAQFDSLTLSKPAIFWLSAKNSAGDLLWTFSPLA